MIRFLLLGLFISFLGSCERYDEDILPIVGTYEGVIVGLSGPFIMSITADYGDDIFIEAPFDGEIWSVIEADIDDKEEYRKRIDIHHQELERGVFIWGEGVFYDYSVQLDYVIEFFGDEYIFSLVASKY